jgi:hypothetical protein
MQAHISSSLEGLDFRKKYGLTEYIDSERPLVIFGMYNYEDFRLYRQHKGKIIVVWQGMDSQVLIHENVVDILKKEATHYSISHWIKNALECHGINSFYAPISATIGTADPKPRGNNIYFYTSNLSPESSLYYGEDMIEEIKQRTGLNVIVARYDTYTKEELYEVYKSCFINLRLTKFDGCPNTNLEMGLMGRRSVYNGDIPMSIKWNGVDDIYKSIMHEYYTREHDNKNISEITSIFVNSVNDIFL